MFKRKIIFITLLGFVAAGVFPVFADEISDLRKETQSLRSENQILQEKLKNQDALLEKLSQRLEKLEIKEAQPMMQDMEKDSSLFTSLPKMDVRGFADIGFKADKAANAIDSTPSTFTLGEFDFMVSSALSERISFFSENVIEFSNNGNEIEIERLYLKYSLSDYLHILVGRIHTPFGYWNPRYHHGNWFQTSASRPLVIDFEAEGGLLPAHMVGIDFEGKKEFSAVDFKYDLGVSNGRHNSRTKVQNTQDGNDAKAFNGQFSLLPHSLPGLEFGINAYVDRIPADAANGARSGEIEELILGGYIAYMKDKLEFMLEGYQINHDDEASRKDYKTLGMFAYLGYKFTQHWTPYYCFDFLDFGQGDPYYSTIDIDTKKHSLGLRWDLASWNALKFEYNFSDRKNASDKHTVILKDSFHF